MILGIIQARVSSSRLPGKVLKPVLGVPMILRQIERVQNAKLIDHLVIATSQDVSDDPLEKICKDNGLDCFRGSLNDVLDRFYQAAKLYHPDHVVRLTGDCPLADPKVIDQVIQFHFDNNYDYSSNTIETTYPDGLDIEIMCFACLEKAWKEATLSSQREHVTPFIHQQPQLFKLGSFKNRIDLSHLRWTVDEPADFEVINTIYENLYQDGKIFTMEVILSFLQKNSKLMDVNSMYQRNEGYQKSLREDRKIK